MPEPCPTQSRPSSSPCPHFSYNSSAINHHARPRSPLSKSTRASPPPNCRSIVTEQEASLSQHIHPPNDRLPNAKPTPPPRPTWSQPISQPPRQLRQPKRITTTNTTTTDFPTTRCHHRRSLTSSKSGATTITELKRKGKNLTYLRYVNTRSRSTSFGLCAARSTLRTSRLPHTSFRSQPMTPAPARHPVAGQPALKLYPAADWCQARIVEFLQPITGTALSKRAATTQQRRAPPPLFSGVIADGSARLVVAAFSIRFGRHGYMRRPNLEASKIV
ncbi:putative leucine-rich repeat extensin-like protein 3 [Iris pallida]|uniref:Leucine-rich repeat extensin-like protein 3 n=1 Tax=Iris pallida TaxID=29817 RepID=A0AAX6IA09_IRIPA|nr:putative leucine-rich repeat extensin-like protein 3 [Iris pallida]